MKTKTIRQIHEQTIRLHSMIVNSNLSDLDKSSRISTVALIANRYNRNAFGYICENLSSIDLNEYMDVVIIPASIYAKK